MDNINNEIENIKINDPVRFEPEKEPENKIHKEHVGPYERVGLEPVEPIKNGHKSGIVTKISFVLLMLFSAAVGAYFVWALMF